MSASVQRFTAPDSQALERMVGDYLARGFVVVGRTDRSALLRKEKRFNAAVALVSSLACGVGLLVYLLVYAAQRDEIVEIFVLEAGRGGPFLSDDRRWWWDGERWQDTEQLVPPGSQRSGDGAYWWDGASWRPVPPSERTWPTPPGPPDE